MVAVSTGRAPQGQRRRPCRGAALAACAAAAVAALRVAREGFVAAGRGGPRSEAAAAAEVQDGAASMAALQQRRSLLAGLGASLFGGVAADPAKAWSFPGQKDLVATFKVDLGGEQGGGGEVKVRLHPEWAPRGVKRFKELVRMGEFEDAAVFHVSKGAAHFGLPAEPTLTPDHIKDDLVRTSNRRGTLTFSQDTQNGRVNQLFFNTKDNDGILDRKGYAPIGEVVEGMDIVDSFYGGYGTRPSRYDIKQQGNDYLDEQFPKLSKIMAVEIPA